MPQSCEDMAVIQIRPYGEKFKRGVNNFQLFRNIRRDPHSLQLAEVF